MTSCLSAGGLGLRWQCLAPPGDKVAMPCTAKPAAEEEAAHRGQSACGNVHMPVKSELLSPAKSLSLNSPDSVEEQVQAFRARLLQQLQQPETPQGRCLNGSPSSSADVPTPLPTPAAPSPAPAAPSPATAVRPGAPTVQKGVECDLAATLPPTATPPQRPAAQEPCVPSSLLLFVLLQALLSLEPTKHAPQAYCVSTLVAYIHLC